MIGHLTLSNYTIEEKTTTDKFKNEVIKDFWICLVSRETSILGRKEVLTGKAKFGILGDGKEVPQAVMARVFKKGDFRSGYYRDQTLMFALGVSTVEDFFAQLYADVDNDPFSGGRQMNSHFATPIVDEFGQWTDHTKIFNTSSDISSTAGQMARAVGLAQASSLYRNNEDFVQGNFSSNGDEVVFCTIGDASTSEGPFWESINAAGVLKVPLVVSIWDDGYGISVPTKYQTTKGSIGKLIKGFDFDENNEGIRLYTAKAWDYAELTEVYETAIRLSRKDHIPAIIHITEVTQPQGHSTSGSHERYKSPERLLWEKEKDCIKIMSEWMVTSGICAADTIQEMKVSAKKFALEAKNRAWENYYGPVRSELSFLSGLYNRIGVEFPNDDEIVAVQKEMKSLIFPLLGEALQNARRMKFAVAGKTSPAIIELKNWIQQKEKTLNRVYSSKLYSESPFAATNIEEVKPVFSDVPKMLNGYQILNKFFDLKLNEIPNLIAFGEDVGQIGDVNQGFAGMQQKYGEHKVFDCGIREWTIMGQAIGLAMRGFKPIAEIQYLDYLIYGLSPLSDDLATLRYRSNGLQQAPAIIRTRGHRLEGIWHAGSPLGMLLNSLRGIYIITPRNMVQAAGFYNTMLASDDPALIIECLNGYRRKEWVPENLGEFNVPLGVPEVLFEGSDITLVTYGSCVRIAAKGIEMLAHHGISVELIDVQTLLPFDIHHIIADSIKKTNAVLFLDEDVPGGATAFMMQEVLEKQSAYQYLDAAPRTLTAKAHRPPYGTDGDYFSKPNSENVFEMVYRMMHERDPESFPWLG